jgi:DNA-binding transcriptional ArsR family regulator
MNIKLFKALSNETRLNILVWLRDPKRHFRPFISEQASCRDPEEIGVCVGIIQKKCQLTQSTVSQFLTMLQEANLIIATRIGQWTYYKRNEKTIARLANYIAKEL